MDIVIVVLLVLFCILLAAVLIALRKAGKEREEIRRALAQQAIQEKQKDADPSMQAKHNAVFMETEKAFRPFQDSFGQKRYSNDQRSATKTHIPQKRGNVSPTASTKQYDNTPPSNSVAELAKRAGPFYPYKRQERLITKTEMKFYNTLREVLPDDMILLSKVRLWDVIDVDEKKLKEVGEKNYNFENQIKQKHLDFVMVNHNGIVRMAIELNDPSHDRPERRTRDQFVKEALDAAGVPFFFVRSKPKGEAYDTASLRQEVLACAAAAQYTICPNCGGKLRIKCRKDTGEKFYGCLNFQAKGCRYTFNVPNKSVAVTQNR